MQIWECLWFSSHMLLCSLDLHAKTETLCESVRLDLVLSPSEKGWTLSLRSSMFDMKTELVGYNRPSLAVSFHRWYRAEFKYRWNLSTLAFPCGLYPDVDTFMMPSLRHSCWIPSETIDLTQSCKGLPSHRSNTWRLRLRSSHLFYLVSVQLLANEWSGRWSSRSTRCHWSIWEKVQQCRWLLFDSGIRWELLCVSLLALVLAFCVSCMPNMLSPSVW